MADKMTTAQFAQKVKAKYPQYAHIPDEELAEKVMAKHPEYRDAVDANSQFRGKGAFIDPAYESTVANTPVSHPQNDKPGMVQSFIDNNGPNAPTYFQNPVAQQAEKFLRGALRTGAQTFLHPIDTAKATIENIGEGMNAMQAPGFGEGSAAATPQGQAMGNQLKIGQDAAAHPADTLGSVAAQLAIGKGLDLIGDYAPDAVGAARRAHSAVRSWAIGDADAAALKGLRVGPGSSKALSTVKSVEGARPFLKGAKSLEDLQARIPGAKDEVWGPYQQAVDAIADKRVMGPDGPTTIGELEEERREISANLRRLKAGGPEAMQLAQQKGMAQADLLDREKAVQAALDPHLEATGIDPKTIRAAFSDVAQVGGKVAGKSTIAEPTQPYGFAKAGDLLDIGSKGGLDILKPAKTFGSGLRDIVAGRYWSAKPTDVYLREAFRLAGEKPDFRAPVSSMPRFEAPRLQLESDVPGNADYGQDYSQGGFPAPTARTGQPPPLRPLLAASTSAGEAQPMIGVWKHPGEQRSFQPEATRIDPTIFNPQPAQTPPAPRGWIVGPNGELYRNPLGLLPSAGLQDLFPPQK